MTNQHWVFYWLTYHCSNSWISARVQHNLFHWMSIYNSQSHIWGCLYTESQLNRRLGKVRIGILQCSSQIGQKSRCHCRQVQALGLELKRNDWYVYNYTKLLLELMFPSMHWTVAKSLNSFDIIQKLTSFRCTWLFTTIRSIWKMVATIVIATLEIFQTVTVILTITLTNITLVQFRATGLGACVVFIAGIRFSTAVYAFRKMFATDPTNEVAKTLFVICTWTLVISTNVCAINFIATWISVVNSFIQI